MSLLFKFLNFKPDLNEEIAKRLAKNLKEKIKVQRFIKTGALYRSVKALRDRIFFKEYLFHLKKRVEIVREHFRKGKIRVRPFIRIKRRELTRPFELKERDKREILNILAKRTKSFFHGKFI